ncbi:TonB-dependent receptor [Piscinibacter sakaiensis]|uniref:TonB-dependent receptor n=1 Tax=Piscinibacter sakaiensis TaxID=1547922 RepID=A0A0K8P061_PISS1|nr:TonB-dependent receptor [Piscinibacter sakaiensis]
MAKQIYGREDLDKYGDTNALDVMRRLPGVTIGSGGPRMRGLGSGYTQILINGDPMPQGFALDQLSPSQIERIEVLRAPTAEQSAQAIAGTINIILKEAPRRAQRDLRLGLSDGTQRPTGNANLTIGESRGGLAVSLPVSVFEWRRENHLEIERRQPGSDGAPSQAVQTGDQQVWGWGANLGPRLNWRISDDQTLSIASFLQKGWWNNETVYANRIVTGRPLLDDDPAQNGTWENRRANLTWANRFDEDQRIELRAGLSQSRWTFDARNLRQGAEFQRAIGGGKDDNLTQSGKYNRLLGEAHSLSLGWDLESRKRSEQRNVTELGQPVLPDFEGRPFDARLQRVAVYLQDEWDLTPQWQVYLGLRHERIETETRDDTAPVNNRSAVLSPLAHLTYKLDAQGRDLVRASLTRSYRAPGIGMLLARPSLASQYTDVTAGNTELAPDRIGNPALAPELATGLDLALERYLPGGGMWSVGLFHRRIQDLMRTVTTLRSVPWATVPRWVSQPQNISSATFSGLELELKGRAAEFLPALVDKANPLSLRASLNLYRSRVAALPGPDNRLDSQPPWSATFGADHRLRGLPLTIGGNLSLNPAYDTRLTLDQVQNRSSGRVIDLYALWLLRPGLSMRLAVAHGAQPFGPPNGSTTTFTDGGDFSRIERRTGPQVNFSMDIRL